MQSIHAFVFHFNTLAIYEQEQIEFGDVKEVGLKGEEWVEGSYIPKPDMNN